MTIREALLALGYREKKTGKWLKPIGYMCFSYDERTKCWFNCFKAPTANEIRVYDEQRLVEGDPLKQLKEWECNTRIEISNESSFEFAAFDS